MNLGLYMLHTATGAGRWPHFPLWGWGIGLSIHATVAFIGLRGGRWRERMLRTENEHLRRRHG